MMNEGTQKAQRICGVDVVPGSKLDRVLGAIAGVSMGDRLGLPVETMTHQAIRELTKGRGIDRYYDANDWRTDATTFGPFGPAGSASDDLACTLALMDSIADNGGTYDIDRSAQALLRAADETGMAGWGGSMRFGAQRLREAEDRHRTAREWMPRVPGAPGTGDGVMMRVSPLGAMMLANGSMDLDGMILNVFEEARLTHGHPVAAIGAALVAIAVSNVAHTEHSVRALPNFVLQALEAMRRVVARSMYDAARFEGKFALSLNAWGDGWNMAIDDMYAAFERVTQIPPASIAVRGAQAIAEVTGVESHALQAAPFTIAMAFRDISPEQALLETVNAGGDTDTFGAIVMSIVGARAGVTGLPTRFLAPEDCSLVVREHEALGPRVKRFVDACAR